MNGFPDWEDASQYPKNFDELTYTQWAWEFLRRNKAYKDDYIVIQKISDVAERQRQSNQVARQYDLAVGMLNPSLGVPGELSTENIFVHYPRFSIHETDKFSRFKVDITFDISLPIDVQLREAKEMLNMRIEEESKSKPRLFSKHPPLVKKRGRVSYQNLVYYLRVLDAVDSCAIKSKIAKVLFPTLKNDSTHKYQGNVRVKNHQKAAEKLRDGAYRKLCLKDDEKAAKQVNEN